MTSPVVPPWIEQLRLELGRARHVILTGNVADAYPLDGRFGNVWEAASAVLHEHGCEVVGRYDIADGFRFTEPDGERWFEDQYRLRLQAPEDRRPRGDAAAREPNVRAASDAFSRAATAPGTRRRMPAADAIAAVRWAVGQRDCHVGFVLDLADFTFAAGEGASPEDLRPLALLAHAVDEAAYIPRPDGLRPRNSLVLVAPGVGSAFQRYAEADPRFAQIEIGLPGIAERHAYLASRAGQFFGAEHLDEDDSARHTEQLTRLTDGLHTWDLEALRRTSFDEQVPLSEPRRLVSRFALGRRSSPWDETAADVFAGAREHLRTDVLGQDPVIDAVCTRLRTARYGVGFDGEGGGSERRPRATFFFAGPTGVGKTELAKSLARLLFGDESALITFDMTEYRSPESAARFTGSDPGYVGFDQGGQLVNAVRRRPFSVILFDEVEKAHPSVLDVFIAILDEGRLTDGHGRTASFADTILIFTSNEGSTSLEQRLAKGEQPDEADVRRHFEVAVERKLSAPPTEGLGRPELVGRFRGGVLGFDLLRRPQLAGLTAKFVTQWIRNVERVHGVHVELDQQDLAGLVEAKLGATVLKSGARTLETTLRDLLDDPMAALVADGELGPGQSLVVEIDHETETAELHVAAEVAEGTSW